ncbi:GTPase [candidate division WOR-3 bacterium RBG_13_43_14]|uniref:GTPase n=1 Tax=candidate division WOR-3 bacterium RBG_13_43_14 TaxID=1802590 RepID=A0A1F4U2E8_UNCW3|nr:MAG: GTPase [candidate division WOR-3 bacterium RBG_13_43_14]
MRRVIIMGAAGRDFHNFNTFFRNNQNYKVMCFTATQIPNIDGRKYPEVLSGKLYPRGIPIYPESELKKLILKFDVDVVVFSYSDISYDYVMHKASEVIAAGADFWFLGGRSSVLKSKRKVIAVCATRTGAGKSQTTRRVCAILQEKGYRFSVIRHPMPYGDLSKQIVQRFSKMSDLDRHNCTIEEREEYEPHIRRKTTVFAGVDYHLILKAAEKISDVIVWDGGNNDFSFYKTDLHIVVVDPLRAGDEINYHPSEANVRAADVIIINKIDSASQKQINTVFNNIRRLNEKALIIKAASPTTVDHPEFIKNKRVVVVEDGPTLTHGEMSYGAGMVTAIRLKAKKIVDPRPYAVGMISNVFKKYKHIGDLVPAVGYGKKQVSDLEKTLNNTPADAIIIATPVDLRKFLKFNKPAAKVGYELVQRSGPDLDKIIEKALKKR